MQSRAYQWERQMFLSMQFKIKEYKLELKNVSLFI